MEINTFPKDIDPKVNVIALLKFELAYNGVKIQHVSHYATEIALRKAGRYIGWLCFIAYQAL